MPRDGHALRCDCGTVQGMVSHPEKAQRGVCYCRDCQAFAHALGRAADILDANGGTDVVAAQPQQVTFTAGAERLACLSLTEKGLLRWYASCCSTPIGNTQRDFHFAHVGLLHNCLEHGTRSIEESFGPVRLVSGTASAKGPVDPKRWSTLAGVARFVAALIRARLNGSYRRTPFFDAKTGRPIAAAHVLSVEERERAMKGT